MSEAYRVMDCTGACLLLVLAGLLVPLGLVLALVTTTAVPVRALTSQVIGGVLAVLLLGVLAGARLIP